MIFFGLKPIWDHNFRRTEDENKYLKRLKTWNETTGLQLQLLDNQIATKKDELQHYKDVVSL